MNSVNKKPVEKRGFTIIELLTVMSIIVILIGLLVPSLNRVRRYALTVKQKNQFHAINVALDLYNALHDEYPPSDYNPQNGTLMGYCGAQKLGEAMMGLDLLGFYPQSIFRSDGKVGSGAQTIDFYPIAPDATTATDAEKAEYERNLNRREGPYLKLEAANAFRLRNIFYTAGGVTPDTGILEEDSVVLCDVYRNIAYGDDPYIDYVAGIPDPMVGKMIGLPILYYRADTSRQLHDVFTTDPNDNIYNYEDNAELVEMGTPKTREVHPLYDDDSLDDPGPNKDFKRFYIDTHNTQIRTAVRPYREDSFILISAGFDGKYGTPDDIYNYGN